MSELERQPYEEYCSNIRERPIGWDAYKRQGVITIDEVSKIKSIDKVTLEQRIGIIEREHASYPRLFLGDGGLLARIGRVGQRGGADITQYILVLIGDLLDQVPAFAGSLLAVPRPYEHLLPLLSHTDETIPVLTSKVLTTLLTISLTASSSRQDVPNDDAKTALPTFLSHLASRTQDPYHVDLAVQSYVSLLRSSYARHTFWNTGEGLPILKKILDTAAHGTGSASGVASGSLIQGGVNLQLLYHVLLVFWELTFEEEIAEKIAEVQNLIPTLLSILRSALKEKIARVSTSILYNLVTKSPTVNLPTLLIYNPYPVLSATSQRFTSDPDLSSDLAYLIETLESYQRSQTTFDEYANEVCSGNLRWSPPHRNTDFWKKNSRRIVEENGGELIAALNRALDSADKDVLAVAAHDVGVLVREVPEKRKAWAEFKGKVMRLMEHSDATVRYEALTAVRGFLEHAFS